LRRLAAGLAACAVLGAHAQANPSRWYLQVDNDVFYGTDRWYTSGVRVARVAQSGDHEVEWGLLQEIYTPEAKRQNDIDRPTAARLLGSFARHDRAPGMFRTLELDLGVTGPAALGRQAQELIHRIVPAPHEDWSLQRGNRLDAQAAWVQTQALESVRGAGWHANLHYGAVIGNQIAFAHGGLELRWGHGAPGELSTPVLRFAATPPFTLAAGERDGWSSFAGVNVRVVARNQLLDRSGLDPAVTPERRDVVYRAAVGLTWVTRWSSLAFALVQDSREFYGQRRPHGFGSITLELPF